MSQSHALVSLIARVLLSAIFIMSGAGKIASYTQTAGYMASQGVPGELLPVVIAVEFLGGLGVLLGVLSRWSALAMAGFSIVAALLFHNNFADKMQLIAFMKDMAMAGGLLLITVNGPGRYAVHS